MDEVRREKRRRGRTLGRLIAALRSEDRETRRSAAEALGQSRDSHAVRPLVEAMEDDWAGELRLAVVTALGQIGDPSAIPALVEAVEYQDEAVCAAAADALTAKEGPVVPAVIEALVGEPPRYRYPRRFPDARRRAALATLLGRLDDPTAIRPLAACLDDRDPDLARAAAEALGALAAHHPVPELRAALPPLQRLARQGWSVFLFRQVVGQIEEATAAIKDLPVPAVQGMMELDGLPVPASAPENQAEGRTRPGGGHRIWRLVRQRLGRPTDRRA